ANRRRKRDKGVKMAVDYGSREERWSLAGATALVTGGSKGIGYVLRISTHACTHASLNSTSAASIPKSPPHLNLSSARHAMVEELAGFGARVHTCSRNAAELEECRRRWEEKNLQVTVSVCDVSIRGSREKLMETVRETFNGKLDILVLPPFLNISLLEIPLDGLHTEQNE
uniref:Uncharacterized protein n=3 Tax=Aegilops tauschii subsp. strangulata TaxID=200361 RepID=A0A453J0F7_AEGTS